MQTGNSQAKEIRELCASVSRELEAEMEHNLPALLRMYADSGRDPQAPQDLAAFAVRESLKYTEVYVGRVLELLLSRREAK